MINQELLDNLLEAGKEVLRYSFPVNLSNVVHGFHMGMFKIHGHRLDALQNAIDAIEGDKNERK